MSGISQKEEKENLVIEIAIKLDLLAIVLYVSHLIAKSLFHCIFFLFI
jgi:hypothetical protein